METFGSKPIRIGASTVALTLGSIDGRPVPDLAVVRDAWGAELTTLGRLDPGIEHAAPDVKTENAANLFIKQCLRDLAGLYGSQKAIAKHVITNPGGHVCAG